MRLLSPVLALSVAFSTTALAQPASWEPRGPGGGGALFQPVFSPHVPGEMHVSCDMSELFKTRDMGLSWSMADFRIIGGNRETRVCYTPDPLVLYTIDCANRNRVDLHQPVKSIDGGNTWTPLPGLDPSFEALDIAVDPHDANRVFVVDYSRLYGSQDGGQAFSPPLFTDVGGGGVRIAGIFSDGALILLGTNSGLLVSNDGGRSFQLNPGLSGIDFTQEAMTGFAAAKDGSGTIRMVAVTHNAGDVYLGMYGCEHYGYRSVYVMDWPGPSWTRSTSGLVAGDHPVFAGMSLTDTQTMWLAGGSDAGEPLVAKSVDGGRTWSHSFTCTNNANVSTGWSGDGGDRGWGYGECAMGFGVSPTDSGRAALTDYGFVHVTDDAGRSWRQAYVDPATENPAGSPTPQRRSYLSIGLENTTAWNLLWVDAQTIIACDSDIRGTRSEDAGRTWGFDYSGHALNSMYHAVKRPSDGRLFAATSSIHDLYQSTRLADSTLDAGQGSVLFSTDGGSQWQPLHDFGAIVCWLALHPTQPDTLYASVVDSATGGIYVTRNASAGAASTWTRLAAPARTQGHPFDVRVLDDGTLVATYSGRRDGAGAFTDSSGVFVSTDDGGSWIDRSAPQMHYWTKDVVIDPHDPAQNTWYVGVFSGWGGAPNDLGGLYRTTNRGLAWQKILDVDRVTSVTVSPTDPEEAYATSETDGLWHSTNLTSATPAFTQDPNYPFRQPERVFWNPFVPGEIWVTSFGNGLRVGSDAVAPGRDLRRVTIPTLSFTAPPLGSILPMTPANVIVTNVQRGDLDPDPAIVGDPTRPLAFYDLTDNSVLSVSLTAARRVQVSY